MAGEQFINLTDINIMISITEEVKSIVYLVNIFELR